MEGRNPKMLRNLGWKSGYGLLLLDENLGVILFIRGHHVVSITDAGRALVFAPYALSCPLIQ